MYCKAVMFDSGLQWFFDTGDVSEDMGHFAINQHGTSVSQSKVRLTLAPDWAGRCTPRPPPLHVASRSDGSGLSLIRELLLPVAQTSQSKTCPFHIAFTGESCATIQHVGYACVPHVCASESGPPPAQEWGFFHVCGGHCPDSLHWQPAGRNERCDGRTGSGYPPAETPAAEQESGGTASLLVCAWFV